MDFQRLLIWVCFFFCLGLTVGGVLLYFRLKERGNLPAVRLLQYYLIMMYAFGFYAMWSDVLLRLLFPFNADDELLRNVSNFLSLLGVPFLLIGLATLILWSLRMQRKRSWMLVATGAVLALLLVSLPFWLAFPFRVLEDTESLFSWLMVAGAVFAVVQLSLVRVQYATKRTKLGLALILLLLGALQGLVLLDTLVPEAVLIFLFFLINTALGVYFIYGSDFPKPAEASPKRLSLEGFVEKYGITPREKDVIQEIYQGKTNQEIADTLFVTLQTIKDHTHRIYQKTEVRNRHQLTSLLRKLERL